LVLFGHSSEMKTFAVFDPKPTSACDRYAHRPNLGHIIYFVHFVLTPLRSLPPPPPTALQYIACSFFEVGVGLFASRPCVPVTDTMVPTATSRLGVNGWTANESLALSPFPTSVWRLTRHQHPSQGCHCREMRCWLIFIYYYFENMFFNAPFCPLCL
jgi:hypothetical protein